MEEGRKEDRRCRGGKARRAPTQALHTHATYQGRTTQITLTETKQ